MNGTLSDLFCHDLPSIPCPEKGKILVTGATGYIGGRLVPELLARGYQVRVMVRSPSPEHIERWPDAEITVADALDLKALRAAMDGVHAAYYLIHSLLLGPRQLESAEIQTAINFRAAAEEKNIDRVIYLGALGDTQGRLSTHLRSRMAVAHALEEGKVPTTILRAAVIIGSGSASYEMIKHLVNNAPVIFLPPWARTRCQPIGIRDVIKYLVGVLEKEETAGKSYDIGGNDILTYEMMLKSLARLLGKKRLFMLSPDLGIRSYAYLLSLMTPVPAPIIASLIEGCETQVVCQNSEIQNVLPFQPISYKASVVRAMTREEQDNVHTRWSDAYPPAHVLAIKLHELGAQPRYTGEYSLLTGKSCVSIFQSFCRIGGKEGWLHNNWMWRIRGMLDRMLLGVGTLRGRRSSSTLRINDVIDFWRVEDLRYGNMLLLRAEMKLPGRAWLEFSIEPSEGKNRLSVKAFFQEKGILGKIYWYILLPFHHFIFKNLIEQIEKRS
jgi:uncharacterized protein YbjT (DUF2867 family)